MYQKAYFYLNSKYRWGDSWPSAEDGIAFREEAAALFKDIGWGIRQGNISRGICDTAIKGKQELYLHPMYFSGVVNPDEIPMIEDALHRASTFRLNNTRRLEIYEDMSDEAYGAYLDEHREEMIQAILGAYSTKRRNLYKPDDLSEQIGKPFKIHRLVSKGESRDLAYERVKELVEELIADGRLVTAQTRYGRSIRTAVPADTKTAKKRTKSQEER